MKDVDDDTRANAIALLEEMNGLPQAPVRGMVINVDHAMTCFIKNTFCEWDRGRYPTKAFL